MNSTIQDDSLYYSSSVFFQNNYPSFNSFPPASYLIIHIFIILALFFMHAILIFYLWGSKVKSEWDFSSTLRIAEKKP